MSKQSMPARPADGRASKSFRPALALVLLLGMAVCGDAWAGPHGHGYGHGHGHWHGRSHVGISIGAPLWYGYGPRWYGDPFYDPYPRPLMVLRPAPVYIERGGEPSARLWYFCADPQGYYPYVQACAGGWRSVLPSTVIR